MDLKNNKVFPLKIGATLAPILKVIYRYVGGDGSDGGYGCNGGDVGAGKAVTRTNEFANLVPPNPWGATNNSI